ncbi:Sensor histidine kinase RcsC [Pseudooceanicola algae]|uniref:histidine kinase n=2 Tax=Pseudooceanicola algae TaxID=1537215 RepID=A0A418SHI7_9RHOB|nr:Sensor histidine kinase RcsC [Pseudooceanicola algae]
MRQLIEGEDWADTALGPRSAWPQNLRTSVEIMLASRYPMFIWWGPDLIQLYNDAYTPVMGKRHPWGLGKPAPEVWSDAWPLVGSLAEAVMQEGLSTWSEDLEMAMTRNGYLEEVYFTFAYSPIPNEDGSIGGLFCACTEETQRVLSDRRMAILQELGHRTTNAAGMEQTCAAIVDTLAGAQRDLPFALLYRLDPDGAGITLAGRTGVEPGHACCPEQVRLASAAAAWPFDEGMQTNQPVLVKNIADRMGDASAGFWPDPTLDAILLPLARGEQNTAEGFLVAGLSPRLVWDEGYKTFMTLLQRQVAAAIGNARAHDEERQRAEALAEIDRAKTTFFSNVSHEFRTPLTLMLGPLDDLLTRDSIEGDDRDQIALIQRNGLRLLKLVNTLLDFSRAEAGRMQARYEPVDLAGLTAQLSSNFRSACDAAGLSLTLDVPPLQEPVHVDRDMWEKIVLNLMSNAFKFTFEGGIAISVAAEGDMAVLRVRDTGTGIPQDELPRIFERFHQVENARGRSHEGSGIGLALVHDLVALHAGSVDVESTLGCGTEVTVRLPFGTDHLPAGSGLTDRSDTDTDTAIRAEAYVEEAIRWLPEAPAAAATQSPQAADQGGEGTAEVLLVDDNADMRGYIEKLLTPRYRVRSAADGVQALALLQAQRADLVLSDVMLPKMDGFELLKAVRSAPETRDIPFILLSARAGEEAQADGLRAGADDYLVKPFQAMDLLARVHSNLDLGRVRREAMDAIKEGAARQRFVGELNDALLTVSDPSDLMHAASTVLGQHLGVGRVAYAEIDEAGGEASVLVDWTDGISPSQQMRYRLADFGKPLLARFRRGEPVEMVNLSGDPDPRAKRGASLLAAESRGSFLSMPLIKGGRLEAVLTVQDRKPRHWTDIDVALIRETADRTWAAVERARADAKLRESEERFRQIGEASSDVVWVCDAERAAFEYVSPAFETIYGISRDEVISAGLDQWQGVIHPDDRASFQTAIDRVRTGAHVTHEFRVIRRTDGQVRWVQETDFPLKADDGRVTRIAGLGRDVTEARSLTAQQQVLIAELQHRTRNLIAVVQAVASQTQRTTGSMQEFQSHFRNRLAALSRVQGLLSRADVEPINIGDILRLEVKAIGHEIDGDRIEFAGPRILVRSSVVQTLSLALHELATNALKYGALGNEAGRLKVSWQEISDGEDHVWMRIEWLETGIDTTDDRIKVADSGYGRTLIEQALPHSLGARTSYELNETELRCVIEVPLNNEQEN